MQGFRAHKNGSLAAMRMNMLVFLYIKLKEEETGKVADVPTSVAQDASLDHTDSEFRCQNEVMTTKNGWFYHRSTHDITI